MSALALIVANVVAMPNTLSAIAELSGGGATSVALTTPSEGCGCSQPINRVMSEEEVRKMLEKNAQQHAGTYPNMKHTSLSKIGQSMGEHQPTYEPAQGRVPRPTNPRRTPAPSPPAVPSPPPVPRDVILPCSLVRELCVDTYEEKEETQKFCDRRNWYGRRCEEIYEEFNGDHYYKMRKRYLYICRGPRRTVKWASCDREWTVINCCNQPTLKPSCKGDADRICDRGE